MGLQIFTVEIQPYRVGGSTDIQSECNSITFSNRGSQTAYISGYPLAPNETIVIGGNFGEIDKTIYKLVLGTATDNVVFVLRKKYK